MVTSIAPAKSGWHLSMRESGWHLAVRVGDERNLHVERSISCPRRNAFLAYPRMAEKKSSMVCPACGVTNAPVSPSRRCASCGSPMDPHRSSRSETDEYGRRSRDGFSVLWGGVALLVQVVLTAAIVVGLPMVVRAFDFEGRHGMMVALPVWFVGGILLGMISPGRRIGEPILATLIVAGPTVWHLIRSQTVRTLPTFMYVILALIGVLFALVGTHLGERIQMGPPPKGAGAD